MKKILKNSLYILMGLVLFSCEAEELKVYSCDETINEWAQQNLDKIRIMKRNQWNNLDESRKRAAYVAFTPEQKIALWKGKVEQILTLEWSEEELEHIQTFNQFIDSHQALFYEKEPTEEQLNDLELFAYKWKEKAENELRWSQNLVYAIIMFPNNLLDKNGNVEIVESRQRVLKTVENCHCRKQFDTCGMEGKLCEDADCEEVRNCGLLLMFNCNGRCK